jgi:kexin
MCLYARWYLGSSTQCCRGVCSRTFCSVCCLVEDPCHDDVDHVSFSPDLTWRDIQHIAVRTAEVVNADDPDWDRTAAGRPFSYKYGFGRLNGYEFVAVAQQWQLVKPQTWVELPAVQVGGGTSSLIGEMSGGLLIIPGGVTSTITITQDDLEQNNFDVLEHVTVRVWITHDRRGDVEVEVTSPNGITSVLAARRRVDADKNGFPGWRFMSVKHWSVICYLSEIRKLKPLKG